MSEEELHFFQRHLVAMVEVKRFADSFDQLCFQMEKLWFYLFKRDAADARAWCHKSSTKTLEIERFREACLVLKESSEMSSNLSARIKELLELSKAVQNCYSALYERSPQNGGGYEGGDYYRFTHIGEAQSVALSCLILSIFNDMQKMYG